MQAAKDVANSTASLVKEIKALDADYSEVNMLLVVARQVACDVAKHTRRLTI